MYKSIFLVLILLICGCKSDQDMRVFDNQTVAVTGQIQNQINDKVVLTIGEEQTIGIIKNGNFQIELDLDKSVYATFNHGDQLHDLFIRPGDSLNLVFNPASKQADLTVSGSSTVENQFLQKKKELKSAFQLNNAAIFNRTPSEFSQIVNDYQTMVDTLLKRQANQYPEMDPLFKKQQRYLTKYEMGSLLLDFPLFKSDGLSEPKLPSDYYNFLSDIELNNAVIQNTLEYNTFIRSYLSRKTKLVAKDKKVDQQQQPMSWTQVKIEVIDTEVTLPNIRANLVTESIEWHLYNHGCDNIDSLITIFNGTNPDADDALRINNFANRCTSLRAGKSAPLIAGVDMKGEQFLSSDLMGKYVYVDVWATWCGPCKKETPHFEALIEEYQDNPDFAFVSISFDKRKEAWERFMKKKNLNGIQLISSKNFESKMAEAYGISNIPRYILIDKDGKLIHADAPLPSSKKIKSILAKLAAS